MKTNFSPDCICWPDNEYPFFGFDIEREIASRVKCSVHGERTTMIFQRLYLPAWRRERDHSTIATEPTVPKSVERQFSA
jgi:hypothetical protein